MNEVVVSNSALLPRICVFTGLLTVSQGRKGKSDFQVKKNAIFKRAREHNGQISREILASVYVVCASSGLFNPMVLFRHDARAVLEEMMAKNRQNRGMGDLMSILSRRDVRDLLSSYSLLADLNRRVPWILSSKNSAPCPPRFPQ